ncbi:MAG: hypothetical protein KME23_01775 [Goleter apudmare HA4340-LM2]|jgi:hypothetical protein|nr:hypothetical protein [Goleter apudmare HA4340-LM2]
MNIIICPGIHEPELTQNFISGLREEIAVSGVNHKTMNILIYPGNSFCNLSGFHILQFLRDRLENRLKSPVVFISFSAGVVGAIMAASLWQLLGGHVKAFIAMDGWGVPLWANFPIHRMSHDYFTHWSSSLLGSGHNNFYAEPAVDHLFMWRSPQATQGWWVNSSMAVSPPASRLSAAKFLHLLLKCYEEK